MAHLGSPGFPLWWPLLGEELPALRRGGRAAFDPGCVKTLRLWVIRTLRFPHDLCEGSDEALR